MLYIIFISFFIPFVILSLYSSRKCDLFLSIFIIFIYLAFFGMNYKYGVDWYNYLPIYEEEGDYYLNIEVGYLVLQSFFKALGVSFWVFSFFIKLFFWSTCYLLIKKLTKYPTTTVFLLILLSFPFLNENLRQLLATSFFFIALINVDKKFVLSIILIIFGSLFHISLLLVLPMFFIYKFRFLKNVFVLCIILFIFFNMISISLINEMILLSNIFLPAHYYNKILIYMDMTDPNIGFGYIIRLLFLITFFFIFKSEFKKDQYLRLIWCGVLCLIGYEVIFFELSILWMRLREYFIIFLPLMVSYMISTVVSRFLKAIIFLFFISYSLYSFNNSFLSTNLWLLYEEPVNYFLKGDNLNKNSDEIVIYWEKWGGDE